MGSQPKTRSEEGWPKQLRKGDLRSREEHMNGTHLGGNECGTTQPAREQGEE